MRLAVRLLALAFGLGVGTFVVAPGTASATPQFAVVAQGLAETQPLAEKAGYYYRYRSWRPHRSHHGGRYGHYRRHHNPWYFYKKYFRNNHHSHRRHHRYY